MSIVRDIAYASAALVSSPVWITSLLRTGKWRTDWKGKFGKCPTLPAFDGPTILIHAVSVGEINLIRGLVDRLSKGTDGTLGPCRVVITTTTNTGFARATQVFGQSQTLLRYPLDFSFAVKRFLNAVQPDLVALAELEVWPTFVQQCVQRDIPVCVVNGRLTARSFKRYCMIRSVLRPTFSKLTHVAAQTQDYADRFIALGAPADRVTVLDTMKWDTANISDDVPGAAELAQAMGIDRKRPLIVAGSTAPGEDKLLIDTCPPDVQLMIVPRKPEWFPLVAQHVPAGQKLIRRTQRPDGTTHAPDGSRFFLLDTIGELRKAYSLANVTIVGRSFVKLYGSDMMEPVALGKPTIIGPNYSDFTDTVNALLQGEGIIVTDAPGKIAAELLADPVRARRLASNGRSVIRTRQGSTQRHAKLLLSILAQHRGHARP